uniref:Uncharacterized protein n=1 Tax=Aegilops tauschii TaxID=37682 RepID=M8BMA9_AEGTA
MEDHDIYTPGEEEHEMVREDEEGSASSSTGMKKHSGCGQSESVGTRSSGFTPPDSLGRSTTTPWMTSVTTSPTGSIEICGCDTLRKREEKPWMKGLSHVLGGLNLAVSYQKMLEEERMKREEAEAAQVARPREEVAAREMLQL